MKLLRKQRFFISSLLVVCVTVAALFWLKQSGNRVRAEAKDRFYEQYNRQQSLMAELASHAIEERFAAFHRNLDLVVSLYEGNEVSRHRSEAIKGSLNKIFGSLGTGPVNDIVVFDRQGVALVMAPSDPYTLGRSYAWREYYKWAREKGRRGQVYLSPFIRLEGGPRRGDMAFILAQGIYGPKGEFRGVAICTLNFDELVRKLVVSIHIGKQGHAWLVDSSNRTVLVSPNGTIDGRKIDTTLLPRWPRLYNLLISAEDGKPGSGWYEYEDPSDPRLTVTKVVGFFPVHLEKQLWTLGVATPAREVDALLAEFLHQQETFTTTMLFTILGIAAMLLGLLIKWNRMLATQVAKNSRDLDEARVRLESTFDELLVAKKVAAVGHLALGMVHEIRNPLSAIKMNMQMIRKKISLDATLRENFSIAEGEIKRLNRLLKDILDFARSRPLRLQSSELGELITRLIRLMQEQLEAQGIETEILVSAPFEIVCDPEQIHQVLLNLILNAIEAMQSISGERRLTISASLKGDMAVILVRDTGIGIPTEKISQIFDPFFTTKVSGGGLGLSSLQAIVLRHGGTVTVESESGHGTTFMVSLPLMGPVDISESQL